VRARQLHTDAPVMGGQQNTNAFPSRGYRSAARRAFSRPPISLSVTAGIGMRTRRAATPSCVPATETTQDCSTATSRGPVPLDDSELAPVPGPGSPGVSMHLADIPAIREPILEPRRHPGVPATVPAHPLRRRLRPTSPQGRPARQTGMPAPRQSGRPCRRRKRTFTSSLMMHRYTALVTIYWVKSRLLSGCPAPRRLRADPSVCTAPGNVTA
jgi:hypothetical protein